MPLFHLILVAVIQGLTEFLPVSSSGHLILLPNLTGLQDQGPVIDVAVHVGTLFAVMLYFHPETRRLFAGLPDLFRGRLSNPDARLDLCLILATIPVMVVGLILNITGLEEMMRSTALIGWTMLIFGLVLYWADRTGPKVKDSADWTLRDAIILGFWQAIALIPGTSRSGICMTGARRLGYDRISAARISLLMSIPTIAASGVLVGAEVAKTADTAMIHDAALAALFSFIAAMIALWAMMKALKVVSFTPYVIYRVALGLVLLAIAYT